MGMTFTPSRGDIIRLKLDPTAGHEQNGFRPCLVISEKDYNQASGMVVVLPITSSEARANSPWSIPVQTRKGKSRVHGYILSSQCRTIDFQAPERESKFDSTVTADCLEEAVGRFQAIIDP